MQLLRKFWSAIESKEPVDPEYTGLKVGDIGFEDHSLVIKDFASPIHFREIKDIQVNINADNCSDVYSSVKFRIIPRENNPMEYSQCFILSMDKEAYEKIDILIEKMNRFQYDFHVDQTCFPDDIFLKVNNPNAHPSLVAK